MGILLTTVLIFFSFQNRVVLAEKISNFLYKSPCDNPIRYKIDVIDPRFNLTREDFIESIADAEKIWNKAYGKSLFIFHPKGKLSISLVFDERQQLTNQISNLDTELLQKKTAIQPKIEEYDRRLSDFNKKVTELNQEIDYWNSHGGTSLSDFQKLKDKQNLLQDEAKTLQEMAASLNRSTSDYNKKIGELNQTIDTFNEQLKYRPEEGLYSVDGSDQKIEIYFNISHQELVHTLAHEMGHALGMIHINNAISIMYPRTTQVINLSNDDIFALNKICRKKSIFEIFRNKVDTAINIIKTQGVRGLIDNIRINNFTNPK